MKTSFKFTFLAIILLQVVILYSCEEKIEPFETGLAEFSVNIPAAFDIKTSKGSDTTIAPLQLLLSVEDGRGNVIFNDKLIPIFSFGTGYMSENIEMKAGDFNLTKFMVVNAAGEIVYAAPMRGSPMAYLVIKPLPLQFRVSPGQVTRISTELLEVKDLTPDQFGYAAFGISVIKPVEFWTYAIIDNPLSMAPILITSAKLTVKTQSGWQYVFRLNEKLNHIALRGSDIYYFLVEKDGYLPQRFQFTAEQLLKSSEDNPIILKIPYNSLFNKIILQPGPEKGIDAMISNLNPDKNFGDHKYFETTFLTEPVLAVMRSNRSLIRFNLDTLPKSAVIKKAVLILAYDIPIPFDNSFILNAGPSAGLAWYGAVLQKVTEEWDENKVTWNNQPKTTEVNQVYLAPFIRNTNIIELDVTRLFVSPANNSVETSSPDYGIMFRLWPTEKFPGFRFASSDYERPAMRPKLILQYTI